jgi:hypothetical protein
MTKWQRQRLARKFPTTKEELTKIVQAYQGPITRVAPMTAEERETTKFQALMRQLLVGQKV